MWYDIYRLGISYRGTSVYGAHLPTVVLGGAENGTECWNYADPYVDPSDTNRVAVHRRHACWEQGSARPAVVALETSAATEPSLDLRADLALTACAHTAWSPSGDAILCSDQEADDTSQVTRKRTEIYAFQRDSTGSFESTNGGTLFAHLSLEEMQKAPYSFESGCDSLLHKYAEWCGSEDLIVATVFCQDGDAEDKTRNSRVFLIDISDPVAPAYHDLTDALEERVGHPLDSIGATCASHRLSTP